MTLDSRRSNSDRCEACGVSKQQVLQHHNARIEDLAEQLIAMTAARDLCKRQTTEVEKLRQWQVNHAQVALQSVAAHGRSGVWSGKDCATQADAAMERMSSPVDSVSEGMRDT
jgi:hypothetical protein